jgi:NAD+ diphosphatase
MSDIQHFGPRPRLGYTGSLLERAAERRTDPAFLEALAQRRESGVYLVSGELILLKKTAHGLDPMFTPDEAGMVAGITERVFLGLVQQCGRFGFAVESGFAEILKADDNFHVTDLRSIAVQGLVDADHLAPIAEAKALLHWHARHRFCAN